MKIKMKVIVWIMLLLVPRAFLLGQDSLGVDLTDPVYKLIEMGQLRGVLTRVSQVKPYSRRQVESYLQEMESNSAEFSGAERRVLNEVATRFRRKWAGVKYGNFAFEEEGMTGQFGVQGSTDGRVNTDNLTDIAPNLFINMFMRGDILDAISYEGEVGFGWDYIIKDPINDFDPFYTPYSFNREWDAGFDSPPVTYYIGADIGSELFDDKLWVRFSRDDRDLGMGTNDLLLSADGHDFNALEYRLRLFSWLNIYQLYGNLSHQYGASGGRISHTDLETGTAPTRYDEISYRKNYTLQGFELFPTEKSYFSGNAAVIWNGEIDLGYVAPLVFVFPYQNTRWNYDNLAINLTGGYLFDEFGQVYGSLMFDELSFLNDRTANKPRASQVAYQGGYKVGIPGIPFAKMTFQYTKVEPYVYTHYLVDHPSSSYIYDTSYVNDGETLGYPLQPNSDEFFVGFESMPMLNWQFTLGYQLIRHGTNLDVKSYSALDGDLIPVQGHLEDYLDYDFEDQYADKNFTKDGVYDWTNAVTLKSVYRFSDYPAEINFSYAFSHTFWDTNGFATTADDAKNTTGVIPGYGDGATQLRNIFGVGAAIKY